MDIIQSKQLTAAIAGLIARENPYIDYSPLEVEKAKKACTAEQLEAYRRSGLLKDGDFELFYVVKRFCDTLGLWKAADESYIKALFQAANRYTGADFSKNPYIAAVHVPTRKIGAFTLTEMCYDRGEFFQYDMPDLRAEMIVPKLGFCTEKVYFPAVYEGNVPWMSVCPSEINSMRTPIRHAHDRVLVLGLGLGYYPFAIAQKEDVSSITIVERQKEMIDLFEQYLLPQFPNKEKIRVVQMDAYEYLSRVEEGQFEFCFADIWEGQKDGAEAYLKIREYARRLPFTTFSYWIEEEIRWYLTENYGG